MTLPNVQTGYYTVFMPNTQFTYFAQITLYSDTFTLFKKTDLKRKMCSRNHSHIREKERLEKRQVELEEMQKNQQM